MTYETPQIELIEINPTDIVTSDSGTNAPDNGIG